MTSSHYLKLSIFFTLIGFLFVGGINFLINPFEIMDVSRINGLNIIKPEAANRIRTFKRYQPLYFQPDLLLIGNSRIEMGFDPEHPYFEYFGKVYNLGTPGISVKEQLYLGQRVVESQQIKAIIISLDFVDFLFHRNYKPKKREFHSDATYDKFAALWSLDALFASLKTVMNQNEFQSNRLENGFNPAKDYVPIIKYEGQDVLFVQKINVLNHSFAEKHWNLEQSYGNEESELMIMLRTINSWKSKGIEVFAFINPYHQEYYYAIEENQLMDEFKSWRSTLKSALSNNIPFCDFTELGLEKSDERLNEEELRYFWEPAHYKKELGDIMIPRIVKGC